MRRLGAAIAVAGEAYELASTPAGGPSKSGRSVAAFLAEGGNDGFIRQIARQASDRYQAGAGPPHDRLPQGREPPPGRHLSR